MLVQDYIKQNGLDKLIEEYSIRTCFHESLPLVILNYDQLESPKTDPIVSECRGLVLELGTWNLVARAFPRFFNWGEVQEKMADFNWPCSATSKEDGSLGILYYYKGWRFNTRGSFGGGFVNFSDITWTELFCRAIGKQLDEIDLPKVTYIFELTSVYNKVVRLYENPGAYLLTAFDGEDEIDITTVYNQMLQANLDVKLPEVHSFSSAKQVYDNLLKRAETDPTFEGYVLYDGKDRWKIKSDTYVALHHMRGEDNLFNPKYQIPFILKGETSEVITYFPEAEESITKNQEIIECALDRLIKLWYKTKHIESPRDFGLAVGREPFSSLLFMMRKGEESEEKLREMWKESGELIYKTLFRKKK